MGIFVSMQFKTIEAFKKARHSCPVCSGELFTPGFAKVDDYIITKGCNSGESYIIKIFKNQKVEISNPQIENIFKNRIVSINPIIIRYECSAGHYVAFIAVNYVRNQITAVLLTNEKFHFQMLDANIKKIVKAEINYLIDATILSIENISNKFNRRTFYDLKSDFFSTSKFYEKNFFANKVNTFLLLQ